ncbi:hypothetical protein A9Q76_06195 [Arcobacter sp. 31_11_sub10_T18]|nr:hypothetical protein A9Q76_06195 [Arcobacter sp. 31_11_sub10_T18]
MVFLIFLIPVGLLFGAIYWHDVNNEEKIQTYFQESKCEYVYRYHARFKALCDDRILVINDYFSLDFDSNVEIRYKDIKAVDKKENILHIASEKKNVELYFETQEHIQIFQTKLTQRLQ